MNLYGSIGLILSKFTFKFQFVLHIKNTETTPKHIAQQHSKILAKQRNHFKYLEANS